MIKLFFFANSYIYMLHFILFPFFPQLPISRLWLILAQQHTPKYTCPPCLAPALGLGLHALWWLETESRKLFSYSNRTQILTLLLRPRAQADLALPSSNHTHPFLFPDSWSSSHFPSLSSPQPHRPCLPPWSLIPQISQGWHWASFRSELSLSPLRKSRSHLMLATLLHFCLPLSFSFLWLYLSECVSVLFICLSVLYLFLQKTWIPS